MNSLARWVFLLAVVLSIFTRSQDDFVGATSQRFLPADALTVLAGFLMMFDKIFSPSSPLIVPKEIQRALILVFFGFVPGLLVSRDQVGTLIEIAVHLFVIGYCIIAINLFDSKHGFRQLQLVFTGSAILAALLGITQLVLGRSFALFGFQVGGDNADIAVGTFRNTGQAGTYVYIAFLTAVSSLYAELRSRDQRSVWLPFFAVASILLAGYALITGKVAASIGLLISCASLLIIGAAKRNVKTIILLSVVFSVTGFVFVSVIQDRTSLMDFLVYKWSNRIDPGGFRSGTFMYENFLGALEAFKNNMLLGSGFGGFIGAQRHEVHSTYLKMLGETGLLGLGLYLWFMFGLLRTMRRSSEGEGYYSTYLLALLAVMFGAIVSWSYTYHMRKREFWTTVALIMIAARQVRREGDSKALLEPEP